MNGFAFFYILKSDVMKTISTGLIMLFILLLNSTRIVAQDRMVHSARIKLHYAINDSVADSDILQNKEALQFVDSLFFQSDFIYNLDSVHILGTASPEGAVTFNKQLSERRAISLYNYLCNKYPTASQVSFNYQFLPATWQELATMMQADTLLSNRGDILNVLNSEYSHNYKQNYLRSIDNGNIYKYVAETYLPLLRHSTATLYYHVKEMPPFPMPSFALIKATPLSNKSLSSYSTPVAKSSKAYWAVKTNLLYDAALVPNVGLEVYLGKDWSLAGNWMYAWWKSDRKHNYWRTYGGDVELRKWFGQKAKQKPLQGHHIGVYAQMLTYDFELSNRGYLGDDWHYGGGISYGYSLPIARRLNIDFSIAMGYLYGTYREYLPEDNCYVWQSTNKLHWIGPTKAEVSLVWLLGRTNYNVKKGGAR